MIQKGTVKKQSLDFLFFKPEFVEVLERANKALERGGFEPSPVGEGVNEVDG